MNSFFSSTDDANENMTQFYAVWGRVTDDEPDFSFRYVAGNTKIECDPSMLIDWPHVSKKTEVTTRETISVLGDTSLIDLTFNNQEAVRTNESAPVVVENRLLPGPFKMVDYPEDWMTQHSLPVYKSFGAGSNYYGGNYGRFGKKNPAGAIDMFEEDAWAEYGYDYDPNINMPLDDEEIDGLVQRQKNFTRYDGRKRGKSTAEKKQTGEISPLSKEEAMQEALLENYENDVTISGVFGDNPTRKTKAELIKILREMYILDETLEDFEK